MIPEQINIAIAKACGWEIINGYLSNGDAIVAIVGTKNTTWESVAGIVKRHIPNYFGDLNACHEMELFLMKNHPELGVDYNDAVREACRDSRIDWAISAIAPQRCEAFLKTIGK